MRSQILAITPQQTLRLIFLRILLVFVATGAFVVGAFMPQTALATAGINKTINYQGRLLTAAGAVVADGTYNMQFKIYQDGPGNVVGDTGGTLMWTESWVYGVNTPDNRVTVKNGYFSVNLGSICAVDSTTCTASTGNSQTNTVIDFNQQTLWLSMNVGNTSTAATFAAASGDGEMIPMRRMASAVYAEQANNSNTLGGLSSAQFIQNVSPAAAQQTANINVLSGAASSVAAAQIQGVASATASVLVLKEGATPGTGGDALQVQDSNGVVLTKTDSGGNIISYASNLQLLGLLTPVISTAPTGTAYYYVVTAFNASGETVASVTAVGMANNTSAISWANVPGATGYKVYRHAATNAFDSATCTSAGGCLVSTINNGNTITFTDAATALAAGSPPTVTVGTDLVVRGWGGQSTNNIFELQNSAGADTFSVQHNGFVTAKSAGFIPISTTTVGVVLKDNGGQTADLLQAQNSSAATLFRIDPAGIIGSPDAATGGTLGTTLKTGNGTTSGSTGALTLSTGNATSGSSGSITIGAGTATGTAGGVVVKNGTNSATAFQVQNAAGAQLFNADTTNMKVEVAGDLNTPSGGFGRNQNLLTYSEQEDNAAWGKTSLTVAGDNAVAPDGTTTADTMTITTAATANLSQSVTVSPSTTYTASWWAKLGTATGPTYFIYDNTHAAAIITPTAYGATSAGWQRFSVTFTTPAGTTSVAVAPSNLTSTTGTMYIWGAQLEQASAAGTYIQTGTFAAATANFGLAVDGNQTIANKSATSVGLTIQAAGSQSADLLQIQDNTGLIKSGFDSLGRWYIGATSNIPGSRLYVATQSASNILQVNQGQTGQTGDLFVAEDVGGAPLFHISPSGVLGSGNAATGGTLGTTLQSGNATTSGNTGSLTLATGNATSGNSGSIIIGAGTATGTAGGVAVKNGTNSTAAFQVQNAAGVSILNADTTTSNITIGQGGLIITGLPNPATPTLASVSTTGTLTAQTYTYLLAATGASGETAAIASSPASVTTTGSASKNTLSWTAVTGATGYRIYRSVNGGTTWFYNNVSAVTSLVDNGSTYTWATSGAPSLNLNSTAAITLATGGPLVLDGGAGNAYLTYIGSSSTIGIQNVGGTIAEVANTFKWTNGSTQAAILTGSGLMTVGNSSTVAQVNVNGCAASCWNGYGIDSAGTEKWYQGEIGSDATNDFVLRSNASNNLLRVANSNGAATFKNSTDSTTAFQVQNASATNLLTADTTNMAVAVNSPGTVVSGTTGTDSFNSGGSALPSQWTFYKGSGGTATTSYNSAVVGALRISNQSSYNADCWSGTTMTCNRVLESAVSGDMEIDTKLLTNNAGSGGDSPSAGIFLTTDATCTANCTFMRVEKQENAFNPGFWAIKAYMVQNGLPQNNGASYVYSGDIANGAPIYLRLVRSGNEWTVSYSTDGTNFNSVASWFYALDLTGSNAKMGVISDTTNGGVATQDFDYFNVLASSGGTLGIATPFSITDSFDTNLFLAQQATTNSGGTVTSLYTYMGSVEPLAANRHMQVAIYTDNGSGAPNTLVAASASQSITTGWNSFPVSATLAANTRYWLAFNTDGNANGIGLSRAYTGGCVASNSSVTYGTMPGTAPANSTCGFTYSIYASMTGTGATTTLGANGQTTVGNAIFRASGGSAQGFQVQDATSNPIFTVNTTSNPGVTIGGTVGSGNAFQVQDQYGNNLLTTNTYYGYVGIGVQNSESELDIRANSIGESASLGTTVLTTGDFSTNNCAGWTGGPTCPTGWSASTGALKHTVGNTAAISQSVTLTAGVSYEIDFTQTAGTAGRLLFGLGGNSQYWDVWRDNSAVTLASPGSGTQTFSITPTTDYDGTIDNITIRQLNTGNPTLRVLNYDYSTAFEVHTSSFGKYDLGIGIGALSAETSGNSNTALGYNALTNTTSGGANVAVGTSTLVYNTNGSFNTAVGDGALAVSTTGSSNTAIGQGALTSSIDGIGNTALGTNSLNEMTNGNSNTAVGNGSLGGLQIGPDNTAVGNNAGVSNLFGGYNVFVGSNAGFLNTGSQNVFVGYQAGYNETGSNKLYIANSSTTTPLIGGDFSAGTAVVNGASFTVQNTSAVALLTVNTGTSTVTVGPTGGNTTGPLLVLGIKTTASDPTGTNGAMYYNSSLANFRCYENGSWRNCISGLLGHDSWAARASSTGVCGTAVNGVGILVTSNGTTCTATNGTEAVLETMTTGATATNTAGFNSTTANATRLGYNPTCTAVVKTPASLSAGQRLSIGLFSATPANANDPGGNAIAFRFSNVAGDTGTGTGWRAVTRNGTTATVGAANVGGSSNVAVSTFYTLKFRVDSAASTVYFSVNGGTETAVTATLPASTTDLGAYLHLLTTDTNADTILFNRFSCEQS